MRNRKQKGQIIRIGDRWYVRYWGVSALQSQMTTTLHRFNLGG